MKKLFLVALALLFLCAVILPSMAWAMNIRFNVMYSPKHPLCREAFNPWAKQVAKVTDGRVKVTLFYSSALFKVKQAYDAVATRVGDMGLVLPTYARNRFLVSSVLDLPMVAQEKAKINSEVLWEMYQERLQRGEGPLGLYESGVSAALYKETGPGFGGTQEHGGQRRRHRQCADYEVPGCISRVHTHDRRLSGVAKRGH